MENQQIVLHISSDEALVIHALFARFAETNKLQLIHNAEFVALSNISAQLDKALVAPFSIEYSSLLELARSRVASGYDGPAPGVPGKP